MSTPYIGEIRMFAGNFAPLGWMFCDGRLIPISENETLFQLIGTTYGGNGESDFALPDLRGRIPIHMGNQFGITYTPGQSGGTETVTLTAAQMPAHNHPLSASTDTASSAGTPANATANTGTTALYAPPGATGLDATMNLTGAVGGGQPHDNMAPFLCVNFIISLFGVFPTPT